MEPDRPQPEQPPGAAPPAEPGLGRKVVAGFAAALGLLGLIGASSYVAVGRLRDDVRGVEHTYEVVVAVRALLLAETDGVTAHGAFTITGEQRFLLAFDEAAKQVDAALERLGQVTAADPAQAQRLARLHLLVDERIAFSRQIIQVRLGRGFADAQALVQSPRGKALQGRIRALALEMDTAGELLLAEQERSVARSERWARVVIVVGSSFALVVVGLALVLILRDLGEARAARAALARRTTELQAANQELESFSYSISHDLRAPLRAVDGFSRALAEDCGPQLGDEGRGHLARIQEGARRMGQLIDDLLAFSRLGRAPLALEPVDMSALVAEALASLRAEQAGRATEIRVGSLPGCRGDAALLAQVWINLLSNALKFTRKHEPARVEVGGELRGDEAAYFVRDTGAGFDMRYAARLFGVFQRLHRANEYEGTGVGLAIVQRVIQRHGGRVWAESAPGQGATFRFTLEGGRR